MMMERKKVLERYAYFFNAINNLGMMSLVHTPTIDELNLPKSMVQTAYRDMKEFEFPGGVIDYLCYLSTLTVLYNCGNEKKSAFFNKVKLFTKLEGAFFQKIINLFIEITTNVIDGKNLVRLFNKNPQYLIDSFHYEPFDEPIEGIILQLFKSVYNAYYMYYLEEKNLNTDYFLTSMPVIFNFSKETTKTEKRDKKQKVKS
jgi:hypothetical protein